MRATTLRAEGRGVDLADADDAVVGDELEEDEVAPAEAGRRVADDEGLEVGDLHVRKTITLRSASPRVDGGDGLVDLLERVACR